jgi:PAS domain S-box-containing protein
VSSSHSRVRWEGIPGASGDAGLWEDVPPEPVNILMVDDHAGNLLALEAVLKQPSYRLVKASSGREALKCLLDLDCAVVLMDVKMPDMDGFETAGLIRQREQTKHIPIILLTAIDMSPAHIARGYAIGAVDYLVKPIDADILRSKVRSFVDLYQKSRQQMSHSERLRRLERERHRTQLLEVRAQRDRFFELTHDVMCLLDPDGRILETNPSWGRDLGYRPEELKGRSLVSFFPEADRDRLRGAWSKFLEGHGFVTFEAPMIRKTGEIRWMSWSVIGFPREESFFGIARDITERIQREQDLRKHEQELNDFFENASLGVLWIAESGQILRANRAFLSMGGLSLDGWRGRTLGDVGAGPGSAEAILSQLRRGETVRDAAFTLRCGDGSLKETMIDANVLWDEHRFVHSRCFVRDITSQKQAERRQSAQFGVTRILSESASFEEAMPKVFQMFGTLFDWHAGAAWLREGGAGELQRVSAWSAPQATPSTARSPASPLGGGAVDDVLGWAVRERRPRWRAESRGAEAGPGIRTTVTTPLLIGEDAVGVLELGSCDARPPDEDLLRVLLALGSQIGQFLERRRAEDALRLRTAQVIGHQAALLELSDAERLPLDQAFRKLAEKGAAALGVDRLGIWLFDDERPLLRCRAQEGPAGTGPDLGRTLDLAAFPRYRSALESSRLVAAERARTDVRTSELWEAYLEPSGVVSLLDVGVLHHGRLVGILRHEKMGRPRRWTVEEQEFVGTLADRLSLCLAGEERRKAEEEIRGLNAGLEARVEQRTALYLEALEEQEQFAYSVSHDLRAPLRVMHGFSQALLEDVGTDLPPSAREYARRIMEATSRMENLIKDLLAYSKLTRSEIPLEPLLLDQVVEEALRDCDAELRERKARVRVEGPLPCVRGHLVTLVQVVINLVSNAAKFVAPGQVPEIRIWGETRGDKARIWIEDNGIGIEAAHQERIFRIFERLNRVEDYPGTGVGLAIVRKAMARMGGESGLVSDGRNGSRFWVELLRAEPES